jgi:hypothetical protein
MTCVRSAIPLCVLFEQISTQSRSCVCRERENRFPLFADRAPGLNVTCKRRRRIYSNADVNDVLPTSTLQPDLSKAWRYDGDCGAARWNGYPGTRDLAVSARLGKWEFEDYIACAEPPMMWSSRSDFAALQADRHFRPILSGKRTHRNQSSCPAKAGRPVRRGLTDQSPVSGIPDRPPSRAMTSRLLSVLRRPHTAPAFCAYSQEAFDSGTVRLADSIAFAFAAVPSRMRPAMPWVMPARRNRL